MDPFAGVVRLTRSWAAGYFGLLAVVIAMVSQLALGAMVLPDDASGAQRDDLAAVSVLCRSLATGHQAPQPHHQKSQPALCALSVALALPGVVLVAPVVFPLPVSVVVPMRFARPASRGPPALAQRVGSPRGPPVLV